MKAALFAFLFFSVIISVHAQTPVVDSSRLGKVSVTKDNRIDLLGEKLAEYNENVTKMVKASKGFRLMLLRTNNREEAMVVRSRLLQQYPDQKVYMSYQEPYIKIKFGNFSDKDEANKYKNQILSQKIVTGSVYVLPETIEVKPDKLNATDQ